MISIFLFILIIGFLPTKLNILLSSILMIIFLYVLSRLFINLMHMYREYKKHKYYDPQDNPSDLNFKLNLYRQLASVLYGVF
jgi:hypothetical protein